MIARDVFGVVSEKTIELATELAPDDAAALTELRAALDEELQAQGWPPLDARITVAPDGSWRITEDMAADLAGGNVSIPLGRTYIEQNAEPLKDAWFLARMADRCMRLLDGLRRDDVTTVLRDAFQLGDDLRELEIRQKALREATLGEAQLKASARGTAIRRAGSFATKHGAEAQRRAHELATNKPHWTWFQTRQVLGQEFGVSPETIKKFVTNPKKVG
ncbi:hypothetical protein HKCCE3408_05700 [Rhodobacterales bacterium HKCCE3408]|nr:hypothetical protein [Rhodobacterales bacterium HKCCE3408]